MAEGWARHLRGEVLEVYSAGIETSKTLDNLKGVKLDYVITVCDHAQETCPILPAECNGVHHSFDDPPRLAREALTEEEGLEAYRRVRDEIKDYVLTLPESLIAQL